jgi:MEMO1 family protein
MNVTFASNSFRVRSPAAAGKLYPAHAGELRSLIADFFSRASPVTGTAPKAIIAPHAGYIFSGPVAASAHIQFLPDREVIRRIVLIGPSHFANCAGLAASSADYFATPLGLVPVDLDALFQLSALPQVRILDGVHAAEHSVEVHLPFLQAILKDFKIVPLVTGRVADEQVAEVITALWGGPETRFVISSDLSHYLEYTRARKLDAVTSRAIEQLRAEDIAPDQACGQLPVCGLLRSARRHGLRGRTVDLRNSGDTAGPRGGVVGYGAFAFEEPGSAD